MKQHLVIEMGVIGHPRPDDFSFNRDYPFSYCRICGDVFQPPSQRVPTVRSMRPVHSTSNAFATAPNDSLQKMIERRDWALKHEKRHEADGSLQRFQRSKAYMTPEAIFRLTPYGIFSPSEMVHNPEVNAAAEEAPRMPTDSTNVAYG